MRPGRRALIIPLVAIAAGLALAPLARGPIAYAAPRSAASLPPTGRVLQLFAPTYMSKTTSPYSLADAVTIAENEDLIAAHAPQFTSSTLAAMKAANPNVRVLVYLNGSFDLSTKQSYPLSEYARDANNKFIKSRQYHNWLMDDSNPAWVAQVSQNCTNLLAQTPYDGCFVDMLGDAMLSGSYLTSQPIDPATGQVWTPAQMLAATTAIAQTVTANNPNAIIMANGLLNGAGYYNAAAPTSQLFGGANPVLAELWLRQATKSVTTYESTASWQQEVDMLADAGSRGDSAAVTTKVWTTATAAQLTAWHRYALASFLLGATGSSYFSFTKGQTATEFQTDATNPLDHTPVGAALGPYQAQGTAFTRQFADAEVIVNPTKSPVTVSMATPCTTLDGVLVTTSVSMAAESGQICSHAPTPVVTGVAPPTGTVAGGDTVTITGSGFTNATAVDFGTGNPAASFSVISDTEITAVSPAGSGTVDVSVTGPGGTSSPSSADQFTYQ